MLLIVVFSVLCPFFLWFTDAHVLLSSRSVPYLKHTTVPALSLRPIQCTEGSADDTGSTASRYLESISLFLC